MNGKMCAILWVKLPCIARTVLLFGLLALWPGCRLGEAKITKAPLTKNEQVNEVLKVVPLETSREEVERRLAEAGIEGDFGSTGSVYYCTIWNRDQQTRWHIDVALLFNDAGRLYAARSGNAEISAVIDDSLARPAGNNSPQPLHARSVTAETLVQPADSPRARRRSPFGEPATAVASPE